MFNPKKKPTASISLKDQLEKAGHKDHGGGESHEQSNAAAQVGAWIAQGLGKLFGNLMPSTFKHVELKDSASQVLQTPLGGKIVSTYNTSIIIDADPDIAQLIAEAGELTERASIEADKEVQLAMNAGHHSEGHEE